MDGAGSDDLDGKLWFRHPTECWALGNVVAQEGDTFRITDARGDEYAVKDVDTHVVDPTHMMNADDISNMNNMHEGPLLSLLRLRYMEDAIYTFTGDILISVNPYKSIDGLYDIPADLPDYKTTPVPHVFCVADSAYRLMMETADPTKKNQSMIVSGESGAGKTEGCKYVMRYLASLSERFMLSQDKAARRSSTTARVEKQVLDCNPFLEAFGNAKTVRNDNSSRFGKFLKIEYDHGRIIGARMEHYLLEKARVVTPGDGERNYHAFYQLLEGATDEERSRLSLHPASAFSYLTHGGCLKLDRVDDAADFQEMREALQSVGIGEEQQASMWQVLAGILHLGNVEFAEKAGADGDSEVTTAEACRIAGDLLGADHLDSKLVQRMVNVQGRASCYVVNLNAHQAANARDALSKAVYEKLFAWLVTRTNAALATKARSTAFIGILDIFGFEIFELNSFEQLCINFANEKLQNLFNHHIFVMEMEQYKAEGIDVATIKFADNQPCVDLIEKKPFGVLMMLDEICFLGRDTSDEKYLQKMDQQHKGKNSFYGAQMLRARNFFSIRHFAGEVSYCVDGFIDKNNDTLYSDLQMLMQCSSVPFVCEIFRDPPPPKEEATSAGAGGKRGRGRRGGGRRGGKKSVSTIASKFKTQLGQLNDTLMATTPHYVRCVKPNKLKASHTYDAPMVMQQLLYAGVLETVRIRREGFPFRETYVDFWRRCASAGYNKMVPALATTAPPPAASYDEETGVDSSLSQGLIDQSRAASLECCKHFLEADAYCMGKTKLFMKAGSLDVIHRAYRVVCTVKIQAFWRGQWRKWQWKRGLRALRKVQKNWRTVMLRKKYAAAEFAVTRLQAHAKRRRWVKRYTALRARREQAAIQIQASFKMGIQRRAYNKALADRYGGAALLIQKTYRGHQARVFVNRRRAAIEKARKEGVLRIQAIQRAKMARARFVKAKNGVVIAQSKWRTILYRRDQERKRGAAVLLQRNTRTFLASKHYHQQREAAIKIESVWRGRQARKTFMRQKKAARAIEGAMFNYVAGTGLTDWTQEFHAACSWGDATEALDLLQMKDNQWRRIRDIPVKERILVRNRYDGLKTALHNAAASGSVEMVTMLLDHGADPTAQDLFDNTPLHNSASLGDTALEATQLMLDMGGAKTKVRVSVGDGGASQVPFIDVRNEAGQTALEASFSAAADGVARSGQEPTTFIGTVKYLLASGATAPSDISAQELVEQVQSADKEGGTDSIMAGIQAAARREEELFERRKAERQSDPHYQFLHVAEQERKRQEEEARLAAIHAAEAKERELESLALNRELMPLADEESRRFHHAMAEELRAQHERRVRESLMKREEEEREREEARKAAEAKRLAEEQVAKERVAAERKRRQQRAQQTEAEAKAARAQAKAEREARAAARAAQREAEAEGAGVPPALLEIERLHSTNPSANKHRRSQSSSDAPDRAERTQHQRSRSDMFSPVKTEGLRESKSSSPDDLAAPGQQAQPPSRAAQSVGNRPEDWQELTTPEGLIFYHNVVTDAVQWATPDALTEGGDHDAAAASMPEGPAPPLPSGPPPADDDEPVPEPPAAAPPLPPPEDSNERQVPTNWKVYRTDDGLLYYYDEQTQETTWTTPAGMEGIEPSDSESDDGSESESDDDAFEYKGTPWTRHSTEDGLVYYYNAESDATQWTRPEDLPDSDNDEAESGSEYSSDEDDVLAGQNGWTRHTSEDGLFYYHNEKSGSTQWQLPADF